jgi:predicted enzyme related to lactoylglutathione lyase
LNIQVDDLQSTLSKVIARGGTIAVAPVAADSYHFAMFEDPQSGRPDRAVCE